MAALKYSMNLMLGLGRVWASCVSYAGGVRGKSYCLWRLGVSHMRVKPGSLRSGGGSGPQSTKPQPATK